MMQDLRSRVDFKSRQEIIEKTFAKCMPAIKAAQQPNTVENLLSYGCSRRTGIHALGSAIPAFILGHECHRAHNNNTVRLRTTLWMLPAYGVFAPEPGHVVPDFKQKNYGQTKGM